MKISYLMLFVSLVFFGCDQRQLEKLNERNRANLAHKEKIIAEKNQHIEKITARNYEQEKIMARERGEHERLMQKKRDIQERIMADKDHAHLEAMEKEKNEQERIMTAKEQAHLEAIEKERTERELKKQAAEHQKVVTSRKMLYRFLEPTLKFTAMIAAMAGIALFFIKKEKEGEFHLAKEKMEHDRKKHKTELVFKHIGGLSPKELKAFLEKMTEPPQQLT